MAVVADASTLLPGRRRHASRIVRYLRHHYPAAECALNFDSPFQLLVATILSAQCTDQRVNLVTRTLFRRYPTVEQLARVSVPKLELLIQSTGFFRNKARHIHSCCRVLIDQFDGQVPRELSQLTQLAGVGRKTANVVLGTGFGIASGVVVDTHVARLSRRLGLTTARDPEEVEADLLQCLPRKEWISFSHRMIQHGRALCRARKPLCGECPLLAACPRVSVSEPVSFPTP